FLFIFLICQTTEQNEGKQLEVNSLLPGYSAQYLVEKFIGEGSFGKVAKCRNLSTNQEVAVKISKPTRRDAGLDEISALAKITKLDADKYGLIKFIERFEYRHHICIVYELLDQSLLDFMKARKHRPLLIHEIRSIARQLLISLKGLKEINMAHCDIKPDNIMLVNHASEPFRVKLIDFGLTKKPEDIEPGTTMQNIQYRAPEVILGLPLDERVDMWTVGYVLAWLYTGFHIHPADSEYIVIRALTMRQGMPDQELLDQDESTRVWRLNTPEEQFKLTGYDGQVSCGSMSFDDLIQFYQDKTKIREVEMFINLLRQMIEIDPNKRITPEEALKHSFFTMEQPSADSEKSNSQESASPEVHQQPKTTTVPQETAAAPQEKTVKEDEKKRETGVCSRLLFTMRFKRGIYLTLNSVAHKTMLLTLSVIRQCTFASKGSMLTDVHMSAVTLMAPAFSSSFADFILASSCFLSTMDLKAW
uniref:Protein kinase domain-containing protein n=1 Tax=Oryzias melastigma TaxID=30732 RepID=A0A3B3BGD0_ORYME